MLAPVLVLTPFAGTTVIVKAFAIVIIGGFGNVEGTILAGLLVGLIESFTTQYLDPGLIDIVVFAPAAADAGVPPDRADLGEARRECLTPRRGRTPTGPRTRRFAFLAAALVIAVLPLVLTGSYWQHQPDGLRHQRAARARPRFHSRLCGPAQSRPVGLLRARRLRLDLADHEARRAVLGRVRGRRRVRRPLGHDPRAVRGAPARPLSRDRVARLRGDRPPDPAQLDQPDAGPARHLRDPAAARDRDPGTAGDRLPQSGRAVLPGRRLRAARLLPPRPARAFADRRDAHRDPRGRDLGVFARHQRGRLEGVRLRHRRGGRRRGGMLLCDLRRHAGAGRVLHHRVVHHPVDGDRRRHGHADRSGVRRDPAHAAARALRGIGDLRLVVYGVALTLVVLFMPGGLVQAWQLVRARLTGAPALSR